MAKRFTDSSKWDQAWFRTLTPKMKCAWIYICDKCDHAGIWDADFPAMSFNVGEDISRQEIEDVFSDKIQPVPGRAQYIIKAFIDFQYGPLNPDNRVHKSVIDRINMVLGRTLQGPNKDLISPLQAPNKPLTRTLKGPNKDLRARTTKQESPFGANNLAALWNTYASKTTALSGKNMPTVDLEKFKPGQPRFRSAQERLAFEPSESYWTDVIERIMRSDFCRGKNDRGWLADFDFLVRVETHVKVMEGKYDSRGTITTTNTNWARVFGDEPRGEK